MTTSSSELGLALYDNSGDLSALFQTYRNDMAGLSGSSNMNLIDVFATETNACFTDISGSWIGTSASLIEITGSMTEVTGSIIEITGSITEITGSLTDVSESARGMGYSCQVTSASVQAFASSASFTPITFDTEIFDDNEMHSTSASTTRIVCKKAGRYFLYGMGRFSTIATANSPVGMAFYKNGTADAELARMQYSVENTGTNPLFVSDYVKLDLDDYIELEAGYVDAAASTLDMDEQRFSMIWDRSQ